MLFPLCSLPGTSFKTVCHGQWPLKWFNSSTSTTNNKVMRVPTVLSTSSHNNNMEFHSVPTKQVSRAGQGRAQAHVQLSPIKNLRLIFLIFCCFRACADSRSCDPPRNSPPYPLSISSLPYKGGDTLRTLCLVSFGIGRFHFWFVSAYFAYNSAMGMGAASG